MSTVMLNHTYFRRTIENAQRLGLVKKTFTDSTGKVTDIHIQASDLELVKVTDGVEAKRLQILSTCSCCGLITMHFVANGNSKTCVDCYITNLDKVN